MNAIVPALDDAVTQLGQLLGDRLSLSAAIRDHHGNDPSFHAAAPPDAVVFPETTEEVAAIMRICSEFRVAVVPFGVGSSLEGHIAALQGGVCIDLSHMASILTVNEADLDCRVQAGVTRNTLNVYLRDTGLFFPIDPGADASIGGMVATRASGTNAVRYGTMRENTLGLTVVLADGRIIQTGGRARKSSAGYDLTRLFVGSEGTLGVVTEIQVRLYGIPECLAAAICTFPSLHQAVDTVIEVIQLGVPLSRVELLDETATSVVDRHSKLDLASKPTLFFEFQGTPASVAEQASMVGEIAASNKGDDFSWTSGEEERNRLWQARHDMFWAFKEAWPNRHAWATDVCVPISRLAESLLQVQQDVADNELIAPIAGHVGDGNYHLSFMLEPGNENEFQRAKAVNQRMVERAIAMGGTCTGEHGVGHAKIPYLPLEHGEGAMSVMRSLKQALDPLGLMNPGKILAA